VKSQWLILGGGDCVNLAQVVDLALLPLLDETKKGGAA
jgi:hypothetical protein